MRLLRKEGEKKKENVETDDGKEKAKRKKRMGSSLRPDLAEYKVFAKTRREKSKLVIGAKTINYEGQICKMSLNTLKSAFLPHVSVFGHFSCWYIFMTF